MESGRRATVPAFSLVELLVATAVLSLLLVLLLSITNQTSNTWRYTIGRVQQFREAREGFEAISRKLSQAALNTYWDYNDPLNPTQYLRQSELRFLSGPAESIGAGAVSNRRPSHALFFNAPLGVSSPPGTDQPDAEGLENVLNTWGFFVEFGDDSDIRPDFLTPAEAPPRFRFRMKELTIPSNYVSIYRYTSGRGATGLPANLTYAGREWFTDAFSLTPAPVHVVAENVVALVALPKLSPADLEKVGITDPALQASALAPTYIYDTTTIGGGSRYPTDPVKAAMLNSRNQLPPLVQLTLVAIDEGSARRLANGSTMPDLSVDSLFQADTDSASRFESDLSQLQNRLQELRLSYRTFTTTVSIKAAKWSTDQTN